MNSGIYIIRNNKTQGSAVNIKNRWRLHKKSLRNNNHHCSHLQNAWNKHGEKEFEFYIAEYVCPKNLLKVEQKWIDLFWRTGVLYNICKNAGSNLGFKHSRKTKEYLSLIRKGTQLGNKHALGMKHSEIIKKKLSLLLKGNKRAKGHHWKLSDQTKNRMKLAALKRKPISLETRLKISKNHADVSGKNNPMFGKRYYVKNGKRVYTQ